MNATIPEQRKHTRLELSYPLKLTLCSPNHIDKSFIGCFKNVSTKGACIQLEDRYDRFAYIEKQKSKIELTIDIPQGEQVSLDTRICWIEKESLQNNFSVLIGLEFQGIKEGQLEQIIRLSRMRKKDHQMLNDLFDHHVKRPFRF